MGRNDGAPGREFRLATFTHFRPSALSFSFVSVSNQGTEHFSNFIK